METSRPDLPKAAFFSFFVLPLVFEVIDPEIHGKKNPPLSLLVHPKTFEASRRRKTHPRGCVLHLPCTVVVSKAKPGAYENSKPACTVVVGKARPDAYENSKPAAP